MSNDIACLSCGRVGRSGLDQPGEKGFSEHPAGFDIGVAFFPYVACHQNAARQRDHPISIQGPE